MTQTLAQSANHRILVIDDSEAIHSDFRKTLAARGGVGDAALDEDESVLFGEDDQSPAAQIASLCYEIDSALQGRDGFEMVRRAREDGRPYALAFVDMRMPPGWDGVQTIERLFETDPDLQVVICTAYSDYSWNEILERLGTTDRLLVLKKPFDTAEVAQLAVALTRKWDTTRQAMMKLEELERLVAERTEDLQRAALTDPLTGLPNREAFVQRLQDCARRAEAGGAAYAVMFLDFDRFKIVNDGLGHDVGDMLLKQIAQRLRETLAGFVHSTADPDPQRWLAGRVGGDEFVVLLDRIACFDEAERLAQRLLDAMGPAFHLQGYEVHTTASIGVTSSAINSADPDSMLRDADAAMYVAKMSGRDRYTVFDRSMHQQSVERLELENELRRAVGSDEFTVHYQPIVSCETGQVLGFEALARWSHPQRGELPPGQFIPMAEETGLIIPVGRKILQAAAAQTRRWQRELPDHAELYISVNLSKRQLLEPGLCEQIQRLLDDTGLPAPLLNLEVTETIVMDKPEVFAPLLQDIRRLGVRLSMDDFGTGHSSLNCLNTFPIDVLKIDRTFVRNMEGNSAYTAVVQAIVTLAGNLGMSVTAEGVETAAQLAQIQALDCCRAQGYYFARPLDAAAATQLLRSGGSFAQQPVGASA